MATSLVTPQQQPFGYVYEQAQEALTEQQKLVVYSELVRNIKMLMGKNPSTWPTGETDFYLELGKLFSVLNSVYEKIGATQTRATKIDQFHDSPSSLSELAYRLGVLPIPAHIDFNNENLAGVDRVLINAMQTENTDVATSQDMQPLHTRSLTRLGVQSLRPLTKHASWLDDAEMAGSESKRPAGTKRGQQDYTTPKRKDNDASSGPKKARVLLTSRSTAKAPKSTWGNDEFAPQKKQAAPLPKVLDFDDPEVLDALASSEDDLVTQIKQNAKNQTFGPPSKQLDFEDDDLVEQKDSDHDEFVAQKRDAQRHMAMLPPVAIAPNPLNAEPQKKLREVEAERDSERVALQRLKVQVQEEAVAMQKAHEDELKTFDRKLQEVKQDLTTKYKASLRERTNEIAALKKEIDNKKQEYDNLNQEAKLEKVQLDAQLEQLQLKLDGLNTQKAEIFKELVEAKQQAANEAGNSAALVQQKESQLTTLQTELAQAKQELVRLKAEQTGVQQELNNQRTLVSELQLAKNQAEFNLKQWSANSTTDKNQLQQNLQQASLNLQQAQSELGSLKAQKAQLDQAITQLQQENSQLKTTIQELQRELANTQAAQRQAVTELNTSNALVQNQQTELSRLQTEYSQANAEVNRLKTEQTSVQQQLSNQKMLVSQLQTAKAEAETNLQKGFAEAQNKFDGLTAEKSQLEQKVRQVSLELAQAQNGLDTLKTKRTQLDQEITVLQQENSQLKIAIKELQQNLADAEKKASLNEAARKQAETALVDSKDTQRKAIKTIEEQYQAQIEELNRKMSQFNKEKDAKEAEYEELGKQKQRKINELETRVAELEANANRLRQQLAASGTTADTTQLDNLKTQYQQEVKKLENELTDEQNKVRNYKKTISDLQAEVDEKIRDLAKASSTSNQKVDSTVYERVLQEKKSLEGRLSALEGDYQQASTELTQKKTELRDTQVRLQQVVVLEAELRTKQNQLNTLKSEREDEQRDWQRNKTQYDNTINTLQQQVQQLEADKQSLQTQLQELRSDLQTARVQYQQQLQALRAERDAAQQQLANTRNSAQPNVNPYILELEERIRELQQQHQTSLNTHTANLDREREDWQNEKNRLLQEKQQYLSAAQAKLLALEQEVKSNQIEIQRLTDLNNQLRTVANQRHQQILDLEHGKQVVEQELATVKLLLTDSQTKANYNFQRAEQSAHQLNQLQISYNSLKAQIDQKNQQLHDITNNTNVNFFGSNTQIDNLSARVTQLESEKLKLETDLQDQAREIGALQTRYQSALQTINQLRQDIADKQTAYEQLEQTHYALQAAHNQQTLVANAGANIQKMQDYLDQIQSLKSENAQLRSIRAPWSGKDAICEAEKAQLNLRIAELEGQISAQSDHKYNTSSVLADKVAQQQQQIQQLQQQLYAVNVSPTSVRYHTPDESAVKQFLAVIAAVSG